MRDQSAIGARSQPQGAKTAKARGPFSAWLVVWSAAFAAELDGCARRTTTASTGHKVVASSYGCYGPDD